MQNVLHFAQTVCRVDGINPWESTPDEFPRCFYHTQNCLLVCLSAAGKTHEESKCQGPTDSIAVKVHYQRSGNMEAPQPPQVVEALLGVPRSGNPTISPAPRLLSGIWNCSAPPLPANGWVLLLLYIIYIIYIGWKPWRGKWSVLDKGEDIHQLRSTVFEQLASGPCASWILMLQKTHPMMCAQDWAMIRG